MSLNCLFGFSLEALVKRAFFDELKVPGLDVPGLDVPGLDVLDLDVPGRDPVILRVSEKISVSAYISSSIQQE